MTQRTPRTRQYLDPDGVKTTDTAGVRTGVWLLALAVALLGVALIVVVRPALQRPGIPEPSSSDRAADNVETRPTPAAKRPIQPVPGVIGEPRQPRSAPEPPPPAAPHAPPPGAVGDVPSTADADAAAHQATGIALFPPPGTKPIKRGIIVPEGVELPPGYVRHYQTTDDGHQLPPILMFHPDYHPVDEHGEPIALPEDRVVPADMAPVDLPIEMLDVPEGGPPPEGRPGRARSQPAPAR